MTENFLHQVAIAMGIVIAVAASIAGLTMWRAGMNRHDESGRIAGVCFFACFAIVVLAALTGCTNKIADFHLPEQKAKACPTLVMPPIGTECVLEIHGDTVLSNDCGDTLLRGYVRARSLLKPGAPGTTAP